MIIPEQTHSLNVGILTENQRSFPDTDAIITRLVGEEIGVRTADCVPVVLYAADIKAVAAVHAGWKGSEGGILSITIEKLKEMGSRPENIYVKFGPAICGDCYEVDSSLAERFIDKGFADCISYPDGPDGKPHIDLARVNAERCVDAKILRQNITMSDYCTKHSTDNAGNPIFHSWRRSPGTTLRNFTTIQLLPYTSLKSNDETSSADKWSEVIINIIGTSGNPME